jgi:peptidyl-prolyl cis-trans isomerase B (cyclophilin B)
VGGEVWASVNESLKKAMRAPTNPVVILKTSHGEVTLELFMKEAPKTTLNFLAYAREKHYEGTIFHRVMPNFMIQGGNLDEKLQARPTRAPIVNEASNGLSNKRGTVAMARTSDPNSATDQFFINLKDNTFLDKERDRARVGYAVFGQVIGGIEVVDKIAGVKTAATAVSEGQPLSNVVIKSAVVLQ